MGGTCSADAHGGLIPDADAERAFVKVYEEEERADLDHIAIGQRGFLFDEFAVERG